MTVFIKRLSKHAQFGRFNAHKFARTILEQPRYFVPFFRYRRVIILIDQNE